LSQKIPSSS